MGQRRKRSLPFITQVKYYSATFLVIINLFILISVVIANINLGIFAPLQTLLQSQPILFGLFIIILFAIPSVITFIAIHLSQRYYTEQIDSLETRISNSSLESLDFFTIGALAYDENHFVRWANKVLLTEFSFLQLHDHLSVISNALDTSADLTTLTKVEGLIYQDFVFTLHHDAKNKIFYFENTTKLSKLNTRYRDSQLVFGYIFVDNYDQIQSREDQYGQDIMSAIQKSLNNWARKNDIYLRRYASERFVAMTTFKSFQTLLDDKFTILEEIRLLGKEFNIQTTISIGFSSDEDSFQESARLAWEALELSQGRGGDQVVIKDTQNNVQFFGGQTNPIERRTRVRAKSAASSLHTLMLSAQTILIMGHQSPDLDSFGAALGMYRIAKAMGKDAAVILPRIGLNDEIIRLIEYFDLDFDDFSIDSMTIDLTNYAPHDTLVLVVDTNSPQLVQAPQLLQHFPVAVIDHHRKSGDSIDGIINYVEPYASSTCELVTEILIYQPLKIELSVFEATVMLAGIMLDSKNFTHRTSVRTFDAAATLRQMGADGIVIKDTLKDDLNDYLQKAAVIQNGRFYRSDLGIVIAIDPEREMIRSRKFLAQVADRLLNFGDVDTSFVIGFIDEQTIGISARSTSDTNVQLLMESLGGGGHFNVAAAQLKDMTLEEAKVKLIAVLDNKFKGE
ncbi:MAG: DHH family phosphoesterase [Culicoidibacterales bacterium]